MMQALLRWVIPLGGLLVVGPLAGMCTAGLRLADGSDRATLLVSTSPMMGLVLGAVAIALAAAVGMVGARLINVSYGLFSAGLTLAWAAWGTGDIDAIVRSYQAATPLWRLAAEGAIVGSLGVGACWLILRAGRRPGATPAPVFEEGNVWALRGRGLAACLLGAGVVAWLFAPESMKGQTFAAAAFGGMFGAFALKMAARGVTPLVVFVGVAVLATAGPAVASFYYAPASGFVKAVYAGSPGGALPLVRILPLDWLAGALVGVPIGLSWGGAMTEHAK
jgi:hypothetical protein